MYIKDHIDNLLNKSKIYSFTYFGDRSLYIVVEWVKVNEH